MKSNISILASDSIGIIFEYLTTKNQIAVSRVCTSWYHIVYHTIHSVVFNALDFEAKQNFDPHQITNILLRYTVLYELNIPQAIRVQDDHMEPIFEKFKNSLQKVSIHASDLTNPRFQCPNLKSLKITKDTHLSNIRFEDCINLEEISFNSTAILESQVQIFMKDIVTSNAPLKSLTLSNCKNLRNLQLPSLKTLQLLDIQTTQVFDSVVVGLLASLENLRHLNLSNCPGLKNVQLTNHKHLETVKLIRCKNIFNMKIEQCPQLKSINLDYSPIVSDKLHLLIASNPHVEEWHLAYCKIADYHGSNEESSRLTLSTRLYDLSYSEITDNAVSVYVASSPQLERLLLFYTRVSEPVIFSFSLKELDLTMAFVNNEFVSQIGENCPNLEILSLEYCSSITDISRLASKSLKVLNAARLAIDDQSVTTTLAGCPNLKNMNISGCNNLSKLTINHQNLETIWLSLCRHLTVLYFRDCHSLQQIDIKDSIRLVDLQITCTPFLKKIYVGPPPSNRHLLNLLYEKKIVVQNIDMSAKR